MIDAWKINNVICLELLAACPNDSFELKPGKGKTIRSNFVHLIGVSKMWLEDKLKPFAETIPKLDWKSAAREELIDGLNITSHGMIQVFEKMAPGKSNLICYFAYCIAHEAHHRSQVEISLRIAGIGPDDSFFFDLWNWSKKDISGQ